MNEQGFHDAILALEALAREEKARDAWRGLGEQTVEDFWRAWPEIRGWGEWLWQLVQAERGEHAKPDDQAEVETGEVG